MLHIFGTTFSMKEYLYLENDGDYIIANMTLSLQLLRILNHTVYINRDTLRLRIDRISGIQPVIKISIRLGRMIDK